MMWGHCVHDYVGNVKAWVNIIYSLRFGTKSRRTIWYSTISKSIFQVKWYTWWVKNSILDKNEDDFPHVMRAIAELCDMYKVNEIRDIKKEYFNWFVFEEGWLIVPTKNFIERDNNIFQYYNIVYQENAYFVTDNWNAEKDRLETLITFDVPKEKLALYYRGDLYYPNHVLITLKNQSPFSNRILLLDKTPEWAYEVIYSIPGNEAEALLDWMHPHEVLVKTSDAIILLRKDGNTFNKVFECDYLFENPSAFLFWFEFEFWKQVQNPDDYILIDNKRKFWVLKRNEKWQYSLVMPCVSKTVIRFHWATITEITWSDNKKGIVEYDSTWVRKFVVPCKYSAFTTVNHERLYDQFLVSHKYLVWTNDDSTSDIYSVSWETWKLTYDLLLENVVNFWEPKSHPAIADNFLVVNFQNSETQINSHIYVIDKSGWLNAITIHNDYTIRNRCWLSNGDFVVNTIGRWDVVLRKNSQWYLQEVFVSWWTFDMLKTAMNVWKLNWINIGWKYRICSYQNGNYTLWDMEFNDMPQLWERWLPSHMARANMDDKYWIIACSPEWKIETVVKFKFNHPVNFVHNKAIITVEDSNFSFLLEYKGSNIIEEMILPVSNVVHCSEDIIVQQNAWDVSIYKIQENNSFIPLSVDLPADRVKDQWMYWLDYGQFWHSDKWKNWIVQIEWSGFNTLLPAEYDAIWEFGLDWFPRQYARVMKDWKSERRNSAVSNSKMWVIEKWVNGYYHEVIPTNYFVINYIEEDTIPWYDWWFVAISKDNHWNELYSYYFPDENWTLQAIWKDLKEEITQSHRWFGLYEMPTRDWYIWLFDLDTNGKLVSVLPDGFWLSNDIKADESEYEFVIRNMQSGEYFIVKFNDDKILEYISPWFYAWELTILDYKEIKYLTLYSDTNSSWEVLLRKNEETWKYFNILPPNSTSIHKAWMIHYVQSREHNIYLISKIDENDNIKIELFKNTAEWLNYIPLIRQCELVKDILGLQEKVLLVYDMSYNENHNPYYLRWDTSEWQFFSDYIAKNTYKIVYGNDNFQVVKNPSEMSIDKLMQLSPEFKKYVDNKDRLLDDVPF